MSGPDKRVFKRIGIDLSELQDEQEGYSALRVIIEGCRNVLEDCGYKDHLAAITDGRSNEEAYHFAGLGVLYAEQSLKSLEVDNATNAVWNAVRAYQNYFLAMARHTDFEHHLFIGTKSRRAAIHKRESITQNLVRKRQKIVAELRREGVAENQIARLAAQREGNYLAGQQVPLNEVNNMRKYLQKYSAIKKKRP